MLPPGIRRHPIPRPHTPACPPAAFVVGVGAYTYETLVLGTEGAKVVKEEVTRHPDITSLRWVPEGGGWLAWVGA